MIANNKKRGSAILVTIMVLGVVLVSALSIAFVTIQEYKGSRGASKTITTYQLADEGVEAIMYEITKSGADTIGDIPNCQSNGKIGSSSLGYEVTLFDKDNEVIHCRTNRTLPVSDVKKIKSVGTLLGQSQRSVNAFVPVACNDENDDSYTEALLHFDGGSNGRSFVDATGKHRVYAMNGVSISKTEKKFCRGGYFDGRNDYIYLSNSDELNFGTDNFTIDFWIKPDGLKTGAIFSKRRNTSSVGSLSLFLRSNGDLSIYASSNGSSWDIFSNKDIVTGIRDGVWQHIAIVRNDDEWLGFLNGRRRVKLESLGEVAENSYSVYIGGESDKYYFEGYLDEFRVSSDIARWKTDFAVPEYPY